MIKLRARISIALASLVFIFVPHSQAQVKKTFEAVPAQLRAGLIGRLDLYLEYERTQQYDKLYDLLLISVETPRTLDRDAYVAATRNGLSKRFRTVLLKFKPQATINIALNETDPPRIDIWGEAKVKDGRKSYYKQAAIEAQWVNGNWYFSGVGDVIID